MVNSQYFDPVTCLRQLRYSGLMDTARVRKAGYSVRLTYLEFSKRYLHLIHGSPKRLNSRGIADQICNEHLSTFPSTSVFLGHTKVFLKREAEKHLEEQLVRSYHAHAVVVQNVLRMWICRKRYIKLKKSVVILKNYWKTRKVRSEYQIMRKGIARLQARVVSRRCEFRYKLLKKYITMFQAHCRGFMVRRWALQKLVQKKQKKIMEKIHSERHNLGPNRQPSVIENDNAEENKRIREEYKQIQQDRRNKLTPANVRNMKPVIEELNFMHKFEKKSNVQTNSNHMLNKNNEINHHKINTRVIPHSSKLTRHNSALDEQLKKSNNNVEEKLLFIGKLNSRPKTVCELNTNLHKNKIDDTVKHEKSIVNINVYTNKVQKLPDRPRPKSQGVIENERNISLEATEPMQYVDNMFKFLNDSVDTTSNVKPSLRHSSAMSKFFNTFRNNSESRRPAPIPSKYKPAVINS